MSSMSELKEMIKESVEKHGYVLLIDTAEYTEYQINRDCGKISLSISIAKNLKLFDVKEPNGRESYLALYQHCLRGGVKESATAPMSEISVESLEAGLLWFTERLQFHSSKTNA